VRKAHAPRPSFAEEMAELLVGRVRLAAAITVAGTIVFEVADVVEGRISVALHAIKLVQLLFVVGLVWLLRRPVPRRLGIAITVVSVCVISLGAVGGGVVAYGADTTSILLTIITMTAATVLPWGLAAQAVLVAVSAAAMGFASPWMEMPDGMIYPAVALALAFAVSLYSAWLFNSIRFERWQAQSALFRSEERLAHEAAVSSALARVTREMIASLDQPVLLYRLCALTMEVLDARCSHTLLRNQHGDGWVVVSTCGHPAPVCDAMRGLVLEGDWLRRLSTRDAEGVTLAPAPPALAAHCKSASFICMPLRRGGEVVGVHLAGSAERSRLTRDEERLAGGIAGAASMALANANVVADLERASRLKSEFVSTVSHEIRTPLNVMLGFLEMVEDPEFETAERGELTRRIRTVAHDLLDLVESTLEIGRLEAGRDRAALERVDLPPFWRKLAESCGRFPCRQGVTLEWGPPPDVTLATEPKKLGIVVRNLVGNALKFTERGFVRVTAEVADDRLLLRVADTGIGIPFEEQGAVFEMFRQANGHESRRGGGSGFGLYIVRTFVAQLGGTVALTSTPGAGSVFTVALPLAAPARPAPGTPLLSPS